MLRLRLGRRRIWRISQLQLAVRQFNLLWFSAVCVFFVMYNRVGTLARTLCSHPPISIWRRQNSMIFNLMQVARTRTLERVLMYRCTFPYGLLSLLQPMLLLLFITDFLFQFQFSVFWCLLSLQQWMLLTNDSGSRFAAVAAATAAVSVEIISWRWWSVKSERKIVSAKWLHLISTQHTNTHHLTESGPLLFPLRMGFYFIITSNVTCVVIVIRLLLSICSQFMCSGLGRFSLLHSARSFERFYFISITIARHWRPKHTSNAKKQWLVNVLCRFHVPDEMISLYVGDPWANVSIDVFWSYVCLTKHQPFHCFYYVLALICSIPLCLFNLLELCLRLCDCSCRFFLLSFCLFCRSKCEFP